MSSNYKVGGVWKKTTPYVKVAGVWKMPRSAWTKINGVWKDWFLQGGIVDTTFAVENVSAATGFVNSSGQPVITACAVQTDNKILAGGAFISYNGVSARRLARFNSDGTLDTAFASNTGLGANSQINFVEQHPDGDVVAAGFFTTWNGLAPKYIVKLNPNGTLNTTFSTNIGTSANDRVDAMKIQPDGKILICGPFTTWKGVSVPNFIRLNADGTLDTSFNANIGSGLGGGGSAYAIDVQSDGKIVFVGDFTSFNGTNSSCVFRLNSNGTTDTAFVTNLGTGADPGVFPLLSSVKVQPDGKVLIGGLFNGFNGNTGVKTFTRLNANGTLDTTFNTNLGGLGQWEVSAIEVQDDLKIVVGGSFSNWAGVTIRSLVRLNADGTRDTAFTTNLGTGLTSSGGVSVYTLKKQYDGKILLGGTFTNINSIVRTSFARIGGDSAG